MSLFPGKQQFVGSPIAAERFRLNTLIRNAKGSLWVIFFFSLLNLVLVNFGVKLLFSAEIPLFAADAFLTTGESVLEAGEDASIYPIIGYVIAGILLLPYLLFAILGQKHKWAIIAETVLWSIDTAFCLLLVLADFSLLLDIVIHIIGICELISGVRAYKKLAALPEEQEPQSPDGLKAEQPSDIPNE